MSVIAVDKISYMNWPLRCATGLLITLACAMCMVAAEVYAAPAGSPLNLQHEELDGAW